MLPRVSHLNSLPICNTRVTTFTHQDLLASLCEALHGHKATELIYSHGGCVPLSAKHHYLVFKRVDLETGLCTHDGPAEELMKAALLLRSGYRAA